MEKVKIDQVFGQLQQMLNDLNN